MTGDDSQVGNGTKTRVVLAEDEVLIRLDLVEMLTEEGYDVVGQAGDGEVAVALATDLRPDLVVMDVKMPKLDGISAAEQIASDRIAPVVMLTAFSQRSLSNAPARQAPWRTWSSLSTRPTSFPRLRSPGLIAEIQAVEAEVSDLTHRLESRKVVERAKGLLQSGLGESPRLFAGFRRLRWICGSRCGGRRGSDRARFSCKENRVSASMCSQSCNEGAACRDGGAITQLQS